ncbi:MAG TPA: nucleotide exchange factor GrpE, partial [Myxococcales bacterium]|nr:nucleotide exchange factor GrpE [Myxococcales bacterium]
MGKEFDPEMHQAISLEENDEQEPNTILLVLQRGYFFQERLLRPALVTVSNKSAAWLKANPVQYSDEEAADEVVEAADDAETTTVDDIE